MINKKEKSPTNQKSPMVVTISLSDIANEYLASMTPSSATNLTTTPLNRSLVDLIDHEFNNRLSISKTPEFDDYTVNLTKEEIILKKDRHLFNRLHLVNNKTESRLSSSLNLQSMLTSNNLSSSLPNDNGKLFANNNRHEFLAPVKREKSLSSVQSLLENIYSIQNVSLFADFLSYEHFDQKINLIDNKTNVLFDEMFSYKRQKFYFNEKKSNLRKNRRKIVYEGRVSKRESKQIPSVTLMKKSRNDENRQIMSGSGTSLIKSATPQGQNIIKKTVKDDCGSNSKKSSEQKSIQVFDFSIPSPDDIVVAKQRYAFKNSRLK